jgi:hypothetical protein
MVKPFVVLALAIAAGGAAQAQINNLYEPYEWVQTASAVVLIQRPTLSEERSRITCWSLRGAPKNIAMHTPSRVPELQQPELNDPSLADLAKWIREREAFAELIDWMLEGNQPERPKLKPKPKTSRPAKTKEYPDHPKTKPPGTRLTEVVKANSYLGGRL